MTAERLMRPEIRDLRPYVTARQEPETLRLNANEAPWALRQDANGVALNRYPPIRPLLLEEQLAQYYGVPSDNLLATRGASEAIDLLMRAFCRPGVDEIIVTPPTFAMYRVYADIQGAGVVSVPLRAERDFEFGVSEVLGACSPGTKLIFVCSPNNPTGGLVRRSDIVALAETRQDQSMIVVDEAYVEFSGPESLASLAARGGNLIVLRTLSKAFALAGARCGAVIGGKDLIGSLAKLRAPYALSTPVIDCVLDALKPQNLCEARDSIERIVRERERLTAELTGHPLVEKAWRSQANFILVRFTDPARVGQCLREQRILVRDFHGSGSGEGEGDLPGCMRITVGSRDDNDRLLEALDTAGEAS